jgi:pyrroloquinoline-quinone synthase
MRSANTFKEALRATLRSHLTLAHPLFGEICDAQRPQPALLRLTALQGYQLTRNFLGYVEHLYFHCPLPSHRRALLLNVYEEETGQLSGTDNHVVLMQNFLRALGISDAERDATVALPATAELIRYRQQAVLDPTLYHVAAAAVLVASEGQNLETLEGQSRNDLLRRAYALSDADLRFFSVHQIEDVGHVEQGLDLVAALCADDTMRAEALAAVDHTCKLFHAMYEGIHQEHRRALARAQEAV